jgi:predicted enzyme related to lactoylglutathione lyase
LTIIECIYYNFLVIIISNRVVHFEMNVKSSEKTIRFYQKIFGWKIEKWSGPMEYWLIMKGDEKKQGINGGLGKEEENFP